MDATPDWRIATFASCSCFAPAFLADLRARRQHLRSAPGLSVGPSSSRCCRAKALTGSAMANTAGGCPAPGPAAISWVSPMPAAVSGVGRAGSFRMNWSIRCLPISGSCPACDCNRMRLPWLSKGCARRFPVVAAHRLVAVPSPARHAETRGLGVGNGGCSLRNEHIGVLHAGDTMHSRPPTPAPATLHAPFSA